MTKPRHVSDLMKPGAATITASSSLEDAIHLILGRHVSGLLVLDAAGALVGILTEGDLLRRAELGTQTERAPWLRFLRGPSRQAQDYVEAHSRKVGDVMTSPVVSVEASAPLTDAAKIMHDKHIKLVPVLRDGRLAGVISRSDLLRGLADALAQAPSHSDGPFRDEDIQTAVLAELQRQPWAPLATITVRVVDGVVDLDGVLFAESDRAAMRVIAENVAGVTSVQDHLVWVEPNSGMTYAPP